MGDCSTDASAFDPLWSAVPRLRSLVVLGPVDTLGSIEAPLLETLRLHVADEVVIERLTRARFPAAKSLEIVLAPGYGGARVPDLLFSPAFPSLERFGVRCWTTADLGLVPRDDLAHRVMHAAAARALRRVDLDVPLSPRGVARICADAGTLGAIGALHIPAAAVHDGYPLSAALPVVMWSDEPEEVEPDLPEIDVRPP